MAHHRILPWRKVSRRVVSAGLQWQGTGRRLYLVAAEGNYDGLGKWLHGLGNAGISQEAGASETKIGHENPHQCVQKGIPFWTHEKGLKKRSKRSEIAFMDMSVNGKALLDTLSKKSQMERGRQKMENTARTYAYARVSSRDQNLSRQIEAFKALGIDERAIICDRASGKDMKRDGYMMLRDHLLRPGDTLVIKELDRLGRNKTEIHHELSYYKETGIRVKIMDIPTTMTEFPKGQEALQEVITNMIIEIFAYLAERERENIRHRQREGIDTARKAGVHLGRHSIKRPENWDQVYSRWKRHEITATEAMKQMSLKKGTFYKMVKGAENEEREG